MAKASLTEKMLSEFCDEMVRLQDVNAKLLSACKRALVISRAITIREAIEAGDEAIEAAGLNPWCIAEGLATGDELVSLEFIQWAIDAAEKSKVV